MDLRAVTEGAKDDTAGVAHAAELTALVEAALGADAAADAAALDAAREAVLRKLGPEALVDTAAVIGNFERMTRIADGTGIPLDRPVAALTDDLRTTLRLDRYASGAHTPRSGAFGRAAGAVARRALRPLLRLLARRAEARS